MNKQVLLDIISSYLDDVKIVSHKQTVGGTERVNLQELFEKIIDYKFQRENTDIPCFQVHLNNRTINWPNHFFDMQYEHNATTREEEIKIVKDNISVCSTNIAMASGHLSKLIDILRILEEK